MSREEFVIYGEDERPLLMCHPSDLERMLAIEDKEDRDRLVHLVSIVSPDWEDARAVYDAMWNQ